MQGLLSSSHEVVSLENRYRSPGLLIFGSCSAILGFVLITVIGLIEFFCVHSNAGLKKDYESGNGYWPSTVSEMVYNNDSPGGKLFYTFGLIAGVCIFQSSYPFHLRNVYTGEAKVPGTPIYWTTFRQLGPSMGLWLLVGVNTYPTTVALQSRGFTKMFCVLLHLMGAGMMFVGYMVCEIQCLRSPEVAPFIEPRERKVRQTLAILILGGFVLFCATQCFLNVAKKLDICCGDEWLLKGEHYTDHNDEPHLVSNPEIVNTASGTFLLIKIISFICEDVAGLALVFSHVAIWYFCEERQFDYGKETLKEVHHQKE